MRTLVKVTIPVEAGNAAFKDGRLGKTFMAVIEQFRPEASYFYPEGGKRNALFVLDLKDATQIPVLAERLFSELNAAVELTPVMNLEDLQTGLRQVAGSK
jgi:hypothetical protein